MEFVESPPFTRQVSRYLDEDAYRELQARLSENPEMGDLMPGTGGFRKMRWADARRGKGRRGGLRIIYYHFSSDRQISDDSLRQGRGFGSDGTAEEGGKGRD
jgi:hypothetical protein